MKTGVALVGFMGTGKTAAGRELAAKTGREFIELDALIEEKAGRSIPEIFRDDGEIAFREMEIEATAEVARRKNAVIACGGGLVLNTINVDRLRKENVIICLTAESSVILQRTSGDTDGRPLLAVADRARQIEELLRFRRPFYERAADSTVDTTDLTIERVVTKIMEELRTNAGNDT